RNTSHLLDDVQSELHVAVSAATKYRTFTSKISGLCGGERSLSGLSLIGSKVQPEIAKAQTMRYIDTCQNDDHGFALLKGDSGRREFKSVGRYFDMFRGCLRLSRIERPKNNSNHRRQRREQKNLQLHAQTSTSIWWACRCYIAHAAIRDALPGTT